MNEKDYVDMSCNDVFTKDLFQSNEIFSLDFQISYPEFTEDFFSNELKSEDNEYTIMSLDSGGIFNTEPATIDNTENANTLLSSEIYDYCNYLENLSSNKLSFNSVLDYSDDLNLVQNSISLNDYNNIEEDITLNLDSSTSSNNDISFQTTTSTTNDIEFLNLSNDSLKQNQKSNYNFSSSYFKNKENQNIQSTFSCDICHITLKNAINLKNHKKVVHCGEIKPYTCRYCPKSFIMKSYLARHEERHSSHKLISCFFCHSNFKSIQSLTIHLFTTHVFSDIHKSIFEITLDPIILNAIFTSIEIEGYPNDEDMKVKILGKLSEHIKSYNLHSQINLTPFIQLIFHKNCSKIMTISEVRSEYYCLVCVPQAQYLSQSNLLTKNGKVEGFEIEVLAKICIFYINSKTYILIKSGISKNLISPSDLQVAQ